MMSAWSKASFGIFFVAGRCDGQVVEREPRAAAAASSPRDDRGGGDDEGEVRDADGVPARIPPRLAEGAELLQRHVRDPGLLAELTRRGPLERFSFSSTNPPGQRPAPLERRRARA